MVFDKEQLFEERGRYCECGCKQPAHDAHHAFIHNIKSKGKSKYKELNDPRNIILVNHDEHIARKFDSIWWRRIFWKKQCRRYGEVLMMGWYESLPEKIKPRMNGIIIKEGKV